MTNEMKLLRAFIEASGFDIEEVDIIGSKVFGPNEQELGKFIHDGERFGYYRTTTDYKVTKCNLGWTYND